MEGIFLLRRVTALLFQHIVIILVLTLVCKVKKCESSYTSNPCITMSVVFGAAGLILGGLIGGGVMWKYRRNPRRHRLLDIEKGNNDDNAAAADPLKKIKQELENQKKQLEDEFDGAKVQLQKNKEQLQLVEMKLTQKDTSEKPEAILMEKQNLLHDQWTLDEKKKNCEREILKIEKLLELTGATLLE